MMELTDEKYIGLICNGEFEAVPGYPIGELFESFFDNINYNVIKRKDDIYVDFTGDAVCDDEPCTILIRFIVDIHATAFEIVEVKVNDETLYEEEILDLLEDIAYNAGAIIEDDCCSDEDCHHCMHEDCLECDEDDTDDAFDEEDEEEDDDKID